MSVRFIHRMLLILYRNNEIKFEMSEISRQFNRIALDYDMDRPKFIPCFDEFYGRCTFIIAQFINIPHPKILDLGAGTGLLSAYWLNNIPDATFHLIDISDKMLEISKDRFNSRDNIKFLKKDYLKDFPKEEYDVIISALSLHHIARPEKEKLYYDIISHLKTGGIFVNYDQFKMNDERLEEIVEEDWYKSICQSGIELKNFQLMLKRRELDKETTMEDEIRLLEYTGFKEITCIFRYFKFGVIMSKK